VGRTSTAVEAVGEDPAAVGEAVAWTRQRWRRCGIEAVAWTYYGGGNATPRCTQRVRV
jgi:hypothetical protein